jgi:hypothetical protein
VATSAARKWRAQPADGYTWLFGPDSLVTVNPHVYKQMPFKVEQLLPVTIATQFNQTLVCNPALGVKTVAELIAKAKSESLSYASGGLGVPGHLSMELLQSMAGFQMRHIPYKGPAPATQDVLGNQVPCGLLAGPTVLPHVRAGKLVALAVSGSRRSPTLPDVPTLAEAGVAGYEADFTLVVFAPRGVPDAIVGRFARRSSMRSMPLTSSKSSAPVIRPWSAARRATLRRCSPRIPGSGAPSRAASSWVSTDAHRHPHLPGLQRARLRGRARRAQSRQEDRLAGDAVLPGVGGDVDERRYGARAVDPCRSGRRGCGHRRQRHQDARDRR